MSQESAIFVAIAAYRDPDLVPTIEDCLAKARHPERLRFGVCWQHSPDEVLGNGFAAQQFRVTDVDWRDSRGHSWARAEAMKLYDGEDWYLQLDSHHRFAQDWDTKLITRASLTDCQKPLISAPAPPVAGNSHQADLLHFKFTDFRPDGIPEHVIAYIPSALVDGSPIPTRLISAHFIFAPGSYVEDVPCDPDLYYSCIEVTLAIRAFTNGYDLFTPGEHILWHDHTGGARRRRHWDDHTSAHGVEHSWHDRYTAGIAKIVRFLSEPWVGRYGLGTTRTLADYEAYAGISFRHRRIQDYTRFNETPPNPPASPDWPERVRDHRVEISVDASRLPEAAIRDPVVWWVSIYDGDGRELYRQDASRAELADLLAAGSDRITLVRQFSSEVMPASWAVVPLSASAGALDRVKGAISPPS
jgi:hypothetical protein